MLIDPVKVTLAGSTGAPDARVHAVGGWAPTRTSAQACARAGAQRSACRRLQPDGQGQPSAAEGGGGPPGSKSERALRLLGSWAATPDHPVVAAATDERRAPRATAGAKDVDPRRACESPLDLRILRSVGVHGGAT